MSLADLFAARKRSLEALPAVVLELPPPVAKTGGEVSLSPQEGERLTLNPGESVILGRNSHGRLGENDAKYV